ncbi:MULTISPECIES: TonB-dependent siderophore receptor [Pseudomonas]|uniref:Fe(3+)-pyochelin receptor n=1 Tax=Pseudomonas fluorescens TaxID=294 RepID=A0A5E6XKB7_PSEFL|nr:MULTISPECIES: TonB-dependent siderophore receptor [Pseudomonas]VVN41376.1 Fe(3+)-pyochelin receptor [Pseudomonas fluorescens]
MQPRFPRALLPQLIGRHLLAATLALPLLPVAMVQAAETDSASSGQVFAIEAGSLSRVLGSFAAAAGVNLSYDAQLTASQHSPGLQGRFGVLEGLSRILAGSGLQAYRQADGSYSLRPLPASNGALELGATTIGASTLNTSAETTDSLTVRQVSFAKGEHSLRETPQSVTVITRKMMDEQNLNTLEQVMEKTPGITVHDSPMGGKYFYSRGFMLAGQYQYDGVPLDLGGNYVQANSFASDMAYYDRVEVLRGAAGMLKGSGSSAGGVNFIRKRGQEKAATSVSLSAGSWDNYRAQLDTGGPLNESGSLRGRLVVTGQDRQYFYDMGKRDDQVVYGALDYDFNDATTLGIGAAYEKLNATPCWQGLPRYSEGSDLKLSRATCLGATWNSWESQRVNLFADLTHHFNDQWLLKVAAMHSHNTQDIQYAMTLGSVPVGSTAANNQVYSGLFDYDQHDYGMDAYLDGKFTAWGLEHELIVGANASRAKGRDTYALINMTQLLGVTMDPFAPNRDIPKPPDSLYQTASYRGGPLPVESDTRQIGTYATLRLKLAEPLTLVLGSRVSWYRSKRDSYTQAWDYWQHDRSQENGQVTPFAALIYDLDDTWSVYGSYADIFQPQGTYTDTEGSPLQPKTGANYELGIKGEWLDGGLNAAFNLFRTIEAHRAEADYDSVCAGSSDGYCYSDKGKVRAQGFEAELSGELAERLQVLAGYTYTELEYLKTNSTSQDATFTASYVPRHLLRVWADYQLDGPLQRWSLGGGVNAQSDNHYQDRAAKTVQPGYAIWNARVGYQLDDNWSIAVNGNNLFDKHYYSSVGALAWGNFYGEPRHFMVTLKGDF